AGDGFLVMDRNGDGAITDGRELFGGGTQLDNGLRAGNGYAALAQHDSNADGQISAADADFAKMAVWVDGNQDGITDAGELRSLDDLGIVSLDLGATATTVMDHGNLVGLVSTYTTEDGAEHQMADVWMAKDRSVAGIPTDLLVDPGESVLPGDAAADAPVSVASVAAPVEVPVDVAAVSVSWQETQPLL
ncbi:MAG: heme utilization protein, partial [Burkholderiaceae bacterium]